MVKGLSINIKFMIAGFYYVNTKYVNL